MIVTQVIRFNVAPLHIVQQTLHLGAVHSNTWVERSNQDKMPCLWKYMCKCCGEDMDKIRIRRRKEEEKKERDSFVSHRYLAPSAVKASYTVVALNRLLTPVTFTRAVAFYPVMVHDLSKRHKSQHG